MISFERERKSRDLLDIFLKKACADNAWGLVEVATIGCNVSEEKC